MSYGKKDEDGDTAIMKVDRTSVFQEGAQIISPFKLLLIPDSATL
jgi:hypothetical protein